MIIGITGNKRHGKDTCGKCIQSLLKSSNVKLHSFASPMKEVAGTMFGWDYDRMENHKENVDPYYGISPRQFLQVLGTDFAQFFLTEQFPQFKKITGRSLWVKRLLKHIDNKNINIITDVRFKHEVEAIRKQDTNNIIIKVIRPDWPVDYSHISEMEVVTIEPDYTILNNGTLADLKREVYDFLKQIYNKLHIKKKIYISGPITGIKDNNKVEFGKAAGLLISMGHETYTPFDVTPTRDDYIWEDYMKLDIVALMGCDAIYLLDGWERSKGARLEKTLAESLGLAVYYQGKENEI